MHIHSEFKRLEIGGRGRVFAQQSALAANIVFFNANRGRQTLMHREYFVAGSGYGSVRDRDSISSWRAAIFPYKLWWFNKCAHSFCYMCSSNQHSAATPRVVGTAHRRWAWAFYVYVISCRPLCVCGIYAIDSNFKLITSEWFPRLEFHIKHVNSFRTSLRHSQWVRTIPMVSEMTTFCVNVFNLHRLTAA